MEMDITKELPKSIKIQDSKGKIFEQMVLYEWKSLYCQKCLQVGHVCGERKIEVITKKQDRGIKRSAEP